MASETVILISGAGGKTGRALVEALLPAVLPAGVGLRLFLRREERLPQGVEGYTGDMTRAADWDGALAGVARLYHICPNMHPDEVGIGRLALAAARQAGVEHFVYHSVLHPQAEKMPHHRQKLRVEELLLESGLPFTILQPTAYMQNIRAGWETIREAGVYRVAYPVETRISLVDLRDVAAVAVRVLLGEGHVGATYELVGTAPLSQVEVAQALAAILGRPVRAEAIPLALWQEEARAAGVPAYAMESLLAMFRYYAAHGLAGNPGVLRWLLGREPGNLADWAGG